MKSLRFLASVILMISMQSLSYGTSSSTSQDKNISKVNGKNCLTAINDTFYITMGCGNQNFSGYVLENDILPEGVTAKVKSVVCSNMNFLSFGQSGNFAFNAPIGFSGLVTFQYKICDSKNEDSYSEATVLLYIESDFDCDEVFDDFDLDNDNDGLPDSEEGNATVDTDNDGINDAYDIDDDGDGIPDNIEWQIEDFYTRPSGIDENKNGWDDIYENKFKNGELKIADTDNDGIPDFLDSDSDNDSIPDMVEAFDIDFDFVALTLPMNSDKDKDGLDDRFDTVFSWRDASNSTGSSVQLPDQNNNGIHDFREIYSDNAENNIGVEFEVAKPEPIVNLYPNPSNGIFSVTIPDYSNDEEVFIRVYNTKGFLIYESIADNSTMNINISGYGHGLFLVKINSGDISYTHKVLVKS